MRDIKRIEKMTKLLEQYWSMNPELMFWQMIEMFKSQMIDYNDRDDQFYTEDNETELFLFRKVTDKAPAIKWSQVTGIEVLDADGWISRKQNIDDFEKKFISFDDFMSMASESTCRGHMELFTDWNNGLKVK